ncbi:ComEC/Rec2 family competence protein [Tissierellaceae bacterium HCP3S3_D8]
MKKGKKIIGIISLVVLVFAIFKSQGISEDRDYNSSLEVHFIDVGQGDSILVKSGEEFMLIDGGKNSAADTVVEYLKSQNVNKIKYVIGTHPHEDHIGGLDDVIDTFDIEKVIMPNITHNTKTFEDVLDSIMNKGLGITQAKSGDRYDLGDAEMTILAPNKEKYKDLNDYSVVVRLKYGNTSFMFTGDAEKISEDEMIEVYGSSLKSDVLKLGHHGSTTSTTKRFLELVDPRVAVITVGKDNTYGHPHREVLERVENAEIKIYRTDLDGTIVASSDGNTIEFGDGSVVSGVADTFIQIIEKLIDFLDEN